MPGVKGNSYLSMEDISLYKPSYYSLLLLGLKSFAGVSVIIHMHVRFVYVISIPPGKILFCAKIGNLQQTR